MVQSFVLPAVNPRLWSRLGSDLDFFGTIDGQKVVCIDPEMTPERGDCLVAFLFIAIYQTVKSPRKRIAIFRQIFESP